MRPLTFVVILAFCASTPHLLAQTASPGESAPPTSASWANIGTLEHPIRVSSSVMAGLGLTKVDPQYPTKAKKKHIQGIVRLSGIITADGRVDKLSVTDSPDQLLSDAAIEAVRQWTYKPYMFRGEPAVIATTFEIRFSLNP